MAAFFEFVESQIIDHWVKILVGVILFLAGRLLGRWKAGREWRKKEFRRRVNVSLNGVVDGRLLIRTLFEKDADEVFLNSMAVDAVLAATDRVNEKDPVLHLPEGDRWHVLNAVLNEIAELYPRGTLARDMGLPTRVQRYIFCLTFESAGAINTRKVRVQVLRPELLDPDQTQLSTLEVEHPNHRTRIATLEELQRQYKGGENPDFMAVEVVLPAAPGGTDLTLAGG